MILYFIGVASGCALAAFVALCMSSPSGRGRKPLPGSERPTPRFPISPLR